GPGGRGRRGAGTADVEAGRSFRVAAGAEAAGVELVAQLAAPAVGVGRDGDLVLAGARRAAVAEEVVAARGGLDLGGGGLERRGDRPAVAREDRAGAADGRQL